MSSRLDAVEVKASIGRQATARAMQALALDPDDGERRDIYFSEGAELELLSAGIILRLRNKRSAGKADSTVKLRPFDPASLGRWRDVHDVAGGELRVEGDWTGATHVTAASVVVEQGPDEVAAAVAGKRPLRKLFSRDQEDFLAEQAAMPVEIERLRAYGPVTAVKWEPAARGFLRDLAVEHWRIDDLEFIEVSARVEDPDDAQDTQSHLDQFLDDRGLLGDVVAETKTRTVLEHLVGRGPLV